jgi:hypothetical protein
MAKRATISGDSPKTKRLRSMSEMSELRQQADAAERQRGQFMENMDSAISIDKHALDDCVMQQPELFHRVAEKLALEISLRDEIKDQLSVVQAEVDETIRLEAAQSSTKMTEGAIKMQITMHPDVVMARSTLAKLNKSVGLLSALKESYSQRSYMLKELVSLYLAQYYGDETATASGAKDRSYVNNRRAMQAERDKRTKKK